MVVGGGGGSRFCRAMVLCFGWKIRGRGDSGSGFVGEAATSSIVTMTIDRINPLTEFTAFDWCNSHK